MSTERSNRSQENTDSSQELCFSKFLGRIEKIVKKNFKAAFHKIRVSFNRSKKENLTKIATERLIMLGDNSGDIHLDHLHSLILDIIDTKLYASKTVTITERSPLKNALPINFYSKAVELIRISHIRNHPNVIQTLLCDIQNKNNIHSYDNISVS